MTDELAPPRKSVELQDSGTRDIESSSDEHFSDASEGRSVRTAQGDRSNAVSPIPTTRVERVDDEPAYGEVPGTDAYQKRVQDAVPDEVEVVPDGARSRSMSRVSVNDRPVTPGGTPIPKTVVEKIDPDEPSYGDVPGTDAHKLRLADAEPDVVLKAPEPPQKKNGGSPTASIDRSPLNTEHDDDEVGGADDLEPAAFQNSTALDGAAEEDEDGDFGDDFDDFEEGSEGDDFGDFDDGFQGEAQTETSFDKPPDHASLPAPPSLGPPVLDFTDLTSLEAVVDATNPYISSLFSPSSETPHRSITTSNSTHPQPPRSIFLSDRSVSLWSQLVAPPPLQPPDWVRSRIRRLFLVSLGVPVDLDEILPASKQKKLILPSTHLSTEKSPRPSSDSRPSAGKAGRSPGNASSAAASRASSPHPESRKRKGPPPPPYLDISAATMLCATTEAALGNLTDAELRAHVRRLEELRERAQEVWGYWQGRLESAVGDKEAFESVIENLVAHAKSLR